MNFKNIHIGQLVQKRVKENKIERARICKFMQLTEFEIQEMYHQQHLSTKILLRWSKLLEYDFFRIYSQHIILYSPPTKQDKNQKINTTQLPQFRKNIYTKEVIDFILEQIHSKEMTVKEINMRYNIPKTTLSKCIHKYKS